MGVVFCCTYSLALVLMYKTLPILPVLLKTLFYKGWVFGSVFLILTNNSNYSTLN